MLDICNSFADMYDNLMLRNHLVKFGGQPVMSGNYMNSDMTDKTDRDCLFQSQT